MTLFDPTNRTDKALLDFYERAKSLCIMRGFIDEIKHVDSLKFENQTSSSFLHQYVYVVLNSGISNKAAESMLETLLANGIDSIRHSYKKDAIKSAFRSYKNWFLELSQEKTTEAKLEYLFTLPMIGKVTKYHLARNIGLDVAKPDVHLLRVAQRFKRSDVQEMCQALSNVTGDRIGVVDVIIWRACEQGMMKTERECMYCGAVSGTQAVCDLCQECGVF